VTVMRNHIRPYAWGSRTALAELLGEPSPGHEPQAELWIGAHPSGSSLLIGDPDRARRSWSSLSTLRAPWDTSRRPRSVPDCHFCRRSWPPLSRPRCRPLPHRGRRGGDSPARKRPTCRSAEMVGTDVAFALEYRTALELNDRYRSPRGAGVAVAQSHHLGTGPGHVPCRPGISMPICLEWASRSW
jgi:hypothetical protein